jgi:hypothetical protein
MNFRNLHETILNCIWNATEKVNVYMQLVNRTNFLFGVVIKEIFAASDYLQVIDGHKAQRYVM